MGRATRERSAVQVAAVCYRYVDRSPRFLLVRTSSGKWTFPKGHQERGRTAAEIAALEAHEEAGVIGNVDREPFDSYLHRKRSLRVWDGREVLVLAFLLEVRRTTMPDERNRTPRWFSPEDAKQHLAQRRSPKYHRHLERVIDRAVRRIARRRLLAS